MGFHIGDKVVGTKGSIIGNIGEIIKFGGFKFHEQNYMVQFGNKNEPYECAGSSLDSLEYAKLKMIKK